MLYLEIVIAYSKVFDQSETSGDKCGLFQIHLRGMEAMQLQGDFAIFYPHLSMETVFPALLKLIQNSYINTSSSSP